MRPKDLLERLGVTPFQPFRIQMADGTRLDVLQPRLIVGADRAVVPSRYGVIGKGTRIAEDWRTIALAEIVQFSDLDEASKNRTRHRRKP